MTSRLPAWALAALPAAACLSTPSYKPEAAVAYTEEGTGQAAGARVTAPGFALHFAAGTGFHFPDQLAIDDTPNVLGQDTTAKCFDENEAGFQLSPSYRISGDSGEPGTSITRNELHPVLRGPAVVQVELDWAMRLGTSQHTTSGASTFTVFLDGRIVRHDKLLDAGMPAAHVGDCQCLPGTGDNFNISSYWTFSRNALPSLFAPGPVAGPLPLPDVNGEPSACFSGASYQVATAFRAPASEIDTDLLSIRDTGSMLKYIHFNAIGATQLDGLSWEDRSALFIERSDCPRAENRAKEYLDPPPLTINDASVMPSENDGIYGGDPGNGSPGLALGTNRAVITGRLVSAFAVWLQFKSSVDLLRATRTGGPSPTGPWYIPQQVDSRTWIVWFRDPLADLQTIVIEPN
ncbi:MAG TPA: hypothetical protein VF469_28280 [Kofleriaceae bacterium]